MGMSWPFYVRCVKQILIFSQRYRCDYLSRNTEEVFYLFTDCRAIRMPYLDTSKIFQLPKDLPDADYCKVLLASTK